MKKFIIPLISLFFVLVVIDYVPFNNLFGTADKKLIIISANVQSSSIKKDVIAAILHAASRDAYTHPEVVDIADYNLSFIKAENAPAQEALQIPEVQKFASKIAAADEIIFVVPNINNGMPGTIKNAIDLLWKPWHNKPIGLVGYSLTGQNGDAFIKYFMQVLHAIQSDPVSTTVYITDSSIDAAAQEKVQKMLDELSAYAARPHYVKKMLRYSKDSVKRTLIRLMRKFNS